jgi:hypothetical protein
MNTIKRTADFKALLDYARLNTLLTVIQDVTF